MFLRMKVPNHQPTAKSTFQRTFNTESLRRCESTISLRTASDRNERGEVRIKDQKMLAAGLLSKERFMNPKSGNQKRAYGSGRSRRRNYTEMKIRVKVSGEVLKVRRFLERSRLTVRQHYQPYRRYKLCPSPGWNQCTDQLHRAKLRPDLHEYRRRWS